MQAPTPSQMSQNVRWRSAIGREGAAHQSLPRNKPAPMMDASNPYAAPGAENVRSAAKVNQKSRQRTSCQSGAPVQLVSSRWQQPWLALPRCRTEGAPVISILVPVLMRESTAQGGARAICPTRSRLPSQSATQPPGRKKKLVTNRTARLALPVHVARVPGSSPHTTHDGDSTRPPTASLACRHSPPTTQERTAAAWCGRCGVSRTALGRNDGPNGPHGKNLLHIHLTVAWSTKCPTVIGHVLRRSSCFPSCTAKTEWEKKAPQYSFQFGSTAPPNARENHPFSNVGCHTSNAHAKIVRDGHISRVPLLDVRKRQVQLESAPTRRRRHCGRRRCTQLSQLRVRETFH